MKKLFFSLFLLSALVFACKKETLTTASPEQTVKNGSIAERGGDDDDIYNCVNPDPLAHFSMLAQKRNMGVSGAFGNGWNAGALDELANMCYVDMELDPECAQGIEGVAVFHGLPQFQLSALLANMPSVSSQEQVNIVKKAIAHAKGNIEACKGKTVRIAAIDFTIFPANEGYEVQFGVAYSCCDDTSGD
jgi:hypothetical protein